MQLFYNYFWHSINYKITMLIVSISCQFLIIDAPYPFFTLAARKKKRSFKDFKMLLCLTLGFRGVGEEVQKVNYILNVLVAALYSLQSCKGVYIQWENYQGFYSMFSGQISTNTLPKHPISAVCTGSLTFRNKHVSFHLTMHIDRRWLRGTS